MTRAPKFSSAATTVPLIRVPRVVVPEMLVPGGKWFAKVIVTYKFQTSDSNMHMVFSGRGRMEGCGLDSSGR